jgi:hypothetical protein
MHQLTVDQQTEGLASECPNLMDVKNSGVRNLLYVIT